MSWDLSERHHNTAMQKCSNSATGTRSPFRRTANFYALQLCIVFFPREVKTLNKGRSGQVLVYRYVPQMGRNMKRDIGIQAIASFTYIPARQLACIFYARPPPGQAQPSSRLSSIPFSPPALYNYACLGFTFYRKHRGRSIAAFPFLVVFHRFFIFSNSRPPHVEL